MIKICSDKKSETENYIRTIVKIKIDKIFNFFIFLSQDIV